jgi:short-subunit dehydrogenase involved in D-alanine esterification of teichoic acids
LNSDDSSGIGKALTQVLVNQKESLIISARNKSVLKKINSSYPLAKKTLIYWILKTPVAKKKLF